MNIKGFTQDFSGREAACIGVFGGEGTGKSRFCATAAEWAASRDTTPGWLVCDRKTRRTVREVCELLGLPLPMIQSEDFISPKRALEIAAMDREKDDAKISGIYTDVIKDFVKQATVLASEPKIDPIVLETGTQLWDWISYSHFGRKQGVGKSRVWGPPKQDWTDLLDALSHKTTLITFWERDEYKGDERTNRTKPDGPPHLGYTTTTMVRLNHDDRRKLKDDETFEDRFSLDIYESQEQKGLEGMNGVLTGSAITFMNLMLQIRPEEC